MIENILKGYIEKVVEVTKYPKHIIEILREIPFIGETKIRAKSGYIELFNYKPLEEEGGEIEDINKIYKRIGESKLLRLFSSKREKRERELKDKHAKLVEEIINKIENENVRYDLNPGDLEIKIDYQRPPYPFSHPISIILEGNIFPNSKIHKEILDNQLLSFLDKELGEIEIRYGDIELFLEPTNNGTTQITIKKMCKEEFPEKYEDVLNKLFK